MNIKKHKDFLLESTNDSWTHKGNFKVTTEMVSKGMLIKDKIPDEVTGTFECDNNNLTSLEGSPSIVKGSFNCYSNNLRDLIGGPIKVGGWFDCEHNNLTSLEGCPVEIGGKLKYRRSNENLKTLKGITIGIAIDYNDSKTTHELYYNSEFFDSVNYDFGFITYIAISNDLDHKFFSNDIKNYLVSKQSIKKFNI